MNAIKEINCLTAVVHMQAGNGGLCCIIIGWDGIE